ncbi:DUF551 domain-containing protein [Yersinia pseudotuberculosis]|uniref:DUF551 domain-containing protein n=1 Tax=Yersinia pseudotuberculosis TaxID=633 RepID=UPI000F4EB250|nr:DUF551 domain-containing protein [Yersinia pseudotuberculosis]AYX15445.1 DUF551 domain-containing protein [Yersinia pseudotuberculosis]
MKELNSFTVERLEEIIAEEGYSAMRTPKNDEVRALARIALAAKRAEPVAWEVKGILCHSKEEADSYVGEPVPLYEAPQLNSPEMHDGWIKCRLDDAMKEIDSMQESINHTHRRRVIWRDRCLSAEKRLDEVIALNVIQPLPPGWIDCNDQMPEDGAVVITAYQGCTNIGLMERPGKTYRYFTSIASGRELPATHWMPIPAAPEKP